MIVLLPWGTTNTTYTLHKANSDHGHVKVILESFGALMNFPKATYATCPTAVGLFQTDIKLLSGISKTKI